MCSEIACGFGPMSIIGVGLVVVEAVVNLRYFVGLKTRGARSNMGIYA